MGAFIGLVSGLVFGGGSGGTPAVAKAGRFRRAGLFLDDRHRGDEQPMTADLAKTIGANEMGQVLVLMYHIIGTPEAEWTRTPENFRKDIALLKSEGFYPINVRDLASGNIDIPAGKSPVVITFDDSSPGQYRILDDGSVDPDCAVGIMQAAAKSGDWAPRASFFPLIDVTPKERTCSGRRTSNRRSSGIWSSWGYEVGQSHGDAPEPQESLRRGGHQAARTVPGDTGEPDRRRLLRHQHRHPVRRVPVGRQHPARAASTRASRTHTQLPCRSWAIHSRVALLDQVQGYAHPPHSEAARSYITDAIATFKNHPELRYISDGDPTTVSAPKDLDPKLGELTSDLGRPVIRY